MSGDASGAGDWLERLGAKRSGLILLLAIGVGGFTLGGASVVFFSQYQGLPSRVEVLEDNLSVIAENTSLVEVVTEDVRVIRVQVSELYCDRWPDLCVAAPGGPAPEGSGNE